MNSTTMRMESKDLKRLADALLAGSVSVEAAAGRVALHDRAVTRSAPWLRCAGFVTDVESGEMVALFGSPDVTLPEDVVEVRDAPAYNPRRQAQERSFFDGLVWEDARVVEESSPQMAVDEGRNYFARPTAGSEKWGTLGEVTRTEWRQANEAAVEQRIAYDRAEFVLHRASVLAYEPGDEERGFGVHPFRQKSSRGMEMEYGPKRLEKIDPDGFEWSSAGIDLWAEATKPYRQRVAEGYARRAAQVLSPEHECIRYDGFCLGCGADGPERCTCNLEPRAGSVTWEYERRTKNLGERCFRQPELRLTIRGRSDTRAGLPWLSTRRFRTPDVVRTPDGFVGPVVARWSHGWYGEMVSVEIDGTRFAWEAAKCEVVKPGRMVTHAAGKRYFKWIIDQERKLIASLKAQALVERQRANIVALAVKLGRNPRSATFGAWVRERGYAEAQAALVAAVARSQEEVVAA